MLVFPALTLALLIMSDPELLYRLPAPPSLPPSPPPAPSSPVALPGLLDTIGGGTASALTASDGGTAGIVTGAVAGFGVLITAGVLLVALVLHRNRRRKERSAEVRGLTLSGFLHDQANRGANLNRTLSSFARQKQREGGKGKQKRREGEERKSLSPSRDRVVPAERV